METTEQAGGRGEGFDSPVPPRTEMVMLGTAIREQYPQLEMLKKRAVVLVNRYLADLSAKPKYHLAAARLVTIMNAQQMEQEKREAGETPQLHLHAHAEERGDVFERVRQLTERLRMERAGSESGAVRSDDTPKPIYLPPHSNGTSNGISHKT